MAGVNKVILVGNLGKDPEIKTFESGTKKASFSLATAESYKDKNGEKKENTEWHNIVFWGNLVDVIDKYLKKGNQVYIEGKITSRSYDDKDGNKKYITEIVGTSLVMLGSKPSGGNNNESAEKETVDTAENQFKQGQDVDDLPF